MFRDVRALYARTFSEIKTGAQLRATLRAGAYAWPGGYPMNFHLSDGGAFCFACARTQLENITRDIRDKTDGWRIVGCSVNWEDTELYCENCNAKLESAYGDDEENEGETE